MSHKPRPIRLHLGQEGKEAASPAAAPDDLAPPPGPDIVEGAAEESKSSSSITGECGRRASTNAPWLVEHWAQRIALIEEEREEEGRSSHPMRPSLEARGAEERALLSFSPARMEDEEERAREGWDWILFWRLFDEGVFLGPMEQEEAWNLNEARNVLDESSSC